MNSRQLSYLAHQDPILSHSFRGVFAADEVSDQLSQEQTPHCFIANTDPSDQPGSHWTAFYCPVTGPLEYFCSYAVPPTTFFSLSLEQCDYNYCTINKDQLQSIWSSVCGQYCLYYLHQRCRGMNMTSCLQPFGEDMDRNDRWVNTWIEQRYEIDLNVYDTDFLKKQIARALVEWSYM